MQKKTIPNTFNRPFFGYWINSGLSSRPVHEITNIQKILLAHLSEAIWIPPVESLHISLVNTLDPPPSSEEENSSIRNLYEQILKAISTLYAPTDIHFSKLVVSPSAVFIQAESNEIIQKLRNDCIARLNGQLPVGIQLPRIPDIVHVTIARYTKTIDLNKVEAIIKNIHIAFIETVRNVRLVKIKPLPSVESETIKDFSLGVLP